MVEEGPAIYIFDGDDELAINESIDKIRSRLGDANIAEMNTTRLDGRSSTLPQLQDAVATVPFLAPKRLVIITHPTTHYQDKPGQERFLNFLSSEKPAAKIVLVEYDFLTSDRDRRDGKLNWLEKWATSPEQEKRVFMRHHPQPGGALLIKWIQDRAKSMGGQFSPQAALALANQVGDDTRLADQEITKLLTYVNFSRPVDADDVEHLTPVTAKVGDFELVNALRDRDGRKAGALLHRSLQEKDPRDLFISIAHQIRALIVAREVLDEGGSPNDFPKALKISYYPARFALESVPKFDKKFLELIYHRLLELDEAVKSSQMDMDLALELLVVEFTT
ncbi:MAG: DNA polymerase III subunit delta [Chloroflexi bacterium RBG_16_54_11]|nr:MAG: DNA polymerase III subunit delta [Chloroflexi bacterium RBG_16_54_11]